MNELTFHGKYEDGVFLNALTPKTGRWSLAPTAFGSASASCSDEADESRYDTQIQAAVISATFVVKSSILYLFW